jgi:hypothetical protein
MNSSTPSSAKIIDMHCHVGLLGDKYPQRGGFSEWYRKQLVYKTFLFFAGLEESKASDDNIREKIVEVISTCQLDQVVCLALDPVYDDSGKRQEGRSNVWVDNDFILELQGSVKEKILFGASVHPYDPEFKNRVKKYRDKGAVLLKWVPSSQQINLADDRVKEALRFLAACRDRKPLPLLLHVGPEYAIPSSDSRTFSYDFLCWTFWDKLRNLLRGKKKWHRPQLKKIHENLKAGLDEGAVIIFAHCGLPYFAPNLFRKVFEHSDFKIIRRYLKEYPAENSGNGRCYADVSACATPFRASYFEDIRKLPESSLVFGSDFPTPVFELSADLKENWEDFKAIIKGDFKRIVVPQENLLDVNYRELSRAFPNHPMFTNFSKLG